MQADEGGGNSRSPDYNLWQICRETEASEDEGALLLELAAFADGRLDEDDRERLAARIATDPDAMADIAAARLLAAAKPEAAPEAVIARAYAVHPTAAAPVGSARIIRFPLFRPAANWNGVAQWGSLAAAVMVAGWLGFNLGTDAWTGYSQVTRPSDDQARELLDPSVSFMRDLTEASRS